MMAIEKSMITTTFELPHYKIVKSIGIVRGISVRSRGLIGSIGAGIQTIFGGNITLLTELCEKTRQEAYTMLMYQAEELGANAVIGFRYDANEVVSGVTEVLAYGTAVIVEKISTH
jgi:uncharacterized protein YbjQ (UPF0145 family)